MFYLNIRRKYVIDRKFGQISLQEIIKKLAMGSKLITANNSTYENNITG